MVRRHEEVHARHATEAKKQVGMLVRQPWVKDRSPEAGMVTYGVAARLGDQIGSSNRNPKDLEYFHTLNTLESRACWASGSRAECFHRSLDLLGLIHRPAWVAKSRKTSKAATARRGRPMKWTSSAMATNCTKSLDFSVMPRLTVSRVPLSRWEAFQQALDSSVLRHRT